MADPEQVQRIRVNFAMSLASLRGTSNHKERLARMATEEMGKTIASSRAEVEKCAAGFRHYANAGPAMLEPIRWELTDGGVAEGRWLPQGPVLAVMPWNFPYWQAVRFLAPTILAGNVGLLKHASNVQGVGALMEEMVLQAGGPEGLFQNLAIKSGAVAEIISDDRVIAVTLTGSEGAGRAVAEQAGRHLKKVVLELGGSDPFIVMPSADIDSAVKQAVTARQRSPKFQTDETGNDYREYEQSTTVFKLWRPINEARLMAVAIFHRWKNSTIVDPPGRIHAEFGS